MGRWRVAAALAAVGIAVPGGPPLAALTPAPSATVPPARAVERRPHPRVHRGNTPWLAQGQGLAPRRSALVIGNADYKEDALANGVSDAEEVARTLQEIGFAVTLLRNADLPTMEEAVEAFRRQLGPGDIGLFYYSGHGVQVNGSNYLVPINAKLNRESDVKVYAYPLAIALNALEDANATSRIIILDACRDNPFYRRWRSSKRSSSASRGLATQLSSGSGTLIAFSTAPDQVAADRLGSSKNSPFTTHLLRHLRTPNLEVKELFRRVRKDVVLSTRNEQIPWVNESLLEEVVLNPSGPAVSPLLVRQQAPEPSPSPRPQLQPQPEPQPAPGRQVEESPGIQRQFNPSQQPETESQELSLLTKSLSNRNLYDADVETRRLLLSADAANNVLSKKAIGSLSCQRLRRIDEQWTSYTKGLHGFSSQLARHPGSFNDFEAIVGWRRGGFLTTTTDQGKSQPPGYFPRAVSNGPIHEELLQRFRSCQR
jgi:hypothetical protein